MGVMAAVAGVRTWLYVFMGRKKIRVRNFMTFRTKLGTFFVEHALFVGAVGLMTLQAVFDCRFVDHSLAPIFCNFIVAAETNNGLSFFENMIMGRTMGGVAGGTVLIDRRFMGNLGVFNDSVYFLVALKAKLPRFLFDHKRKISGMR